MDPTARPPANSPANVPANAPAPGPPRTAVRSHTHPPSAPVSTAHTSSVPISAAHTPAPAQTWTEAPLCASPTSPSPSPHLFAPAPTSPSAPASLPKPLRSRSAASLVQSPLLSYNATQSPELEPCCGNAYGTNRGREYRRAPTHVPSTTRPYQSPPVSLSAADPRPLLPRPPAGRRVGVPLLHGDPAPARVVALAPRARAPLPPHALAAPLARERVLDPPVAGDELRTPRLAPGERRAPLA
jgi:hypothetical protein